MARKFTDEQEQEICRRYEAGEHTPQLGAAFGVAPSSVGRVLERNGFRLRTNQEAHGGLSAEAEAEVGHRYEAGETTKHLGPAYGVSPSTICKILKRNGFRLRTNQEAHGGLSAEAEAEVCRRYQAGEGSFQLGAAFGVSSNTVLRVLKRNGVNARINGADTRKCTDAQEQEICRRYVAGENTYQLGAAFGACDVTIIAILKRNGIERRASGIEFGDSVQHILDGTGRHTHPRECDFYLFELARYSDTHCKPGIAFDVADRVRQGGGEYGAEVLRLVFATRAEAYFLEQAVLDTTRGSADCPEDLIDWCGASEVRAMTAADLEPIVLRLADELEDLGPWEFAARHVPMTAAQRAICQQRAAAPQTTHLQVAA